MYSVYQYLADWIQQQQADATGEFMIRGTWGKREEEDDLAGAEDIKLMAT